MQTIENIIFFSYDFLCFQVLLELWIKLEIEIGMFSVMLQTEEGNVFPVYTDISVVPGFQLNVITIVRYNFLSWLSLINSTWNMYS